MDIAKMFSTMGGVMYYGGIIGTFVSMILLLLFTPVFSAERKRILKKIEREYEEIS